MNRHPGILILLFISALSLVSCAVEKEESTTEIQKKILESFISLNYGDIKPLDSGIYIVDSKEGSGRQVADSTYAFVRYSTRNLQGQYISTSYEDVSKQLGTYSKANFYGSYVWPVGSGYLVTAMDDLLCRMKVGGKLTAVIPPTALEVETDYSYSTGDGINKIYDIEIDTLVDNISKYENGQLEAYANKYYNGLDTLQAGFYFKKTRSVETTDTIADATTVYVYYIGKLLNGYVFDTNVADSAKKYDIYSSSKTYSSLSVKYYKDPDTIVEESSVVKGFAKAVNQLYYGEKAVTFFNSGLGYGTDGKMSNGSGVPGYYPLLFEIWIEKTASSDE